jgi:hypothetical protein
MVIITDPHIKVDPKYRVWNKANEMDLRIDEEGSMVSIFVKTATLDSF